MINKKSFALISSLVLILSIIIATPANAAPTTFTLSAADFTPNAEIASLTANGFTFGAFGAGTTQPFIDGVNTAFRAESDTGFTIELAVPSTSFSTQLFANGYCLGAPWSVVLSDGGTTVHTITGQCVFPFAPYSYSGAQFDKITVTNPGGYSLLMKPVTLGFIDTFPPVSVNVPAELELSNFVLPPDNRINWQYGHLDAVVYNHESGDGVVVYCYVDGQTWVGMYVNQAVVDNANTTANATPIVEYNDNGCHVAFYMLDSGEYQINIYTWDGKLYELVADNVNFTNATMREVQ